MDGMHWSFPCFSELPPELRSLVWEKAFSPAAVFATWREGSGITVRRLEPVESVWIMLSCREARAAWLRTHNTVLLLGQEPGRNPSRLDPSRDTVYLRHDIGAVKCIDAFVASQISLSNVAIAGITKFGLFETCEHLTGFPALVTVTFILRLSPHDRALDDMLSRQLAGLGTDGQAAGIVAAASTRVLHISGPPERSQRLKEYFTVRPKPNVNVLSYENGYL
jgi:hypothetical protein